VREHS